MNDEALIRLVAIGAWIMHVRISLKADLLGMKSFFFDLESDIFLVKEPLMKVDVLMS